MPVAQVELGYRLSHQWRMTANAVGLRIALQLIFGHQFVHTLALGLPAPSFFLFLAKEYTAQRQQHYDT